MTHEPPAPNPQADCAHAHMQPTADTYVCHCGHTIPRQPGDNPGRAYLAAARAALKEKP